MSSRRKKLDPPGDGGPTAVAEPSTEANGAAQPAPAAPGGESAQQPAKRFSLPVCDGVWVEGSIWPREVVIDGRTTTAYTATVHKAVRGEDDGIRRSTAFRGSEIPIVQYVLGCCAQWMLDQRREEDPPF